MYKKKLSFCFLMKTSLSALELRHVALELQVLVGGKIEKVFQQEKPHNDFLISIHVPQVGKKYLYATLPNALCLSSFKPSFPQMPPAFCSSLRRKITNAKITAVFQHEFQRIIVFELTTKLGKSSLIIELFSSGNMILVDEEFKILATLHQKIWNEQRKILHGKTYAFPSQDINPLTLTLNSFQELLKSTTKDTLVTCLAVECGLGGTYAEYLIKQTSIDKNSAPSQVDAKMLFETLQTLLSQKTQPIISDEEVFPLPLTKGTSLSSFNEGIASLILKKLEVAQAKESTKDRRTSLSKYDKIIAKQTKQRDGLLISADTNQKIGEAIYTNYQEINALLTTIKDLRKTLSWKEIKEQYKDNPLVVSIDEHTGKVQVKLP